MRARGTTQARFDQFKAEPDRVKGLPADHPAVVEGRTLFPSRVVGAMETKRYLIAGFNNAKIGKVVTKGEWKDMPIFTLTLEERATCPRSCDVWQVCFGNGMPWSNRADHLDPDFMPALKAEIVTMARAYPAGVVIRLHVLGDFFSIEYVKMWADMLDRFPNIKVYGYTHRREDADDQESRTVARMLRWLSDEAWDQFAIRFSRPDAVPQGTIVVDKPSTDPNIIMCPAQTESTDVCGTCALCWSPSARDKTIGFLRHGRKLRNDGAAPLGRRKVRIVAPEPIAVPFVPTEDHLGPTKHVMLAGQFDCLQPYPGDMCCGRRTEFRKSYCSEHLKINNKPLKR